MAARAKSTALISLAESPNAFRQAPQNLEAEQALLGSVLVSNDAMHHLGHNLRAEHFYAGTHQRLFAAIQSFFDKGLIANPITLKHYFDQDEGLKEMGGGQYLAKLAAAATAVINVRDYADMVYDLAQKRALIGIGEGVVNTAYKSELDLPANEQIEAAEQQLFTLASSGVAEHSFKPIKASMVEAIERVEHAYRNNDRVIGVPTKLTDLDKLLGGLHSSDLVILAGRPSMGKTALATTIAHHAAEYFRDEAEKEGTKVKSVGFFSLEMSAEQLASRLLAGETGFNSNKLRKGDLTQEEFSVLVKESTALSKLPFHIDDTAALPIAALRTRARRLKRVHNMGLLVVDYLQLVRASNTNAQSNRVQEVTEITQGLKAIAKELSVPVLALAQLSRAVEMRDDKKPQLSDLRESGSIEQDADVVMFVFREEYYEMRKQPREGTAAEHSAWQENMNKIHGLAEIIVAKHRNGPIGNVTLQFRSDVTKFSDLAKDEYLPARRD